MKQFKYLAVVATIFASQSGFAQWAVNDAQANAWLFQINTNIQKSIVGQETMINRSDMTNSKREDFRYQQDLSREEQKLLAEAAKRNQSTVIACADRSGGGASGAARAGASKIAAIGAGFIAASRENMSPIDATEQTLGAKKKLPELCTETDVRNNTYRKNGCSSEGNMANAQRKAGSLFAAPGTGSTTVIDNQGNAKDPNKSAPSYSYDDKQHTAALYAARNIVSGVPPAPLPSTAEGNGPGRTYLALVDKYEARLSTATEALTNIISKNVKPKTLTTKQKEFWESSEPVFKEIYGETRKFSDAAPTENEVLRLNIFQADTDIYQKGLNVSGDELTKHLINRVNLLIKVQFMNYDQNQRLTAIQAAALAQSIEPVTSQTLQSAYRDAVGSSK